MPPNYIKGDKKRCNGPLHNGDYIPLKEFWVHKSGKRKGKPFSQCRHCENYQKFGDTAHGLVPYSRVKFIFEELENRLGKAESLRRIGASYSFAYHHRYGYHKGVRVAIVIRAIKVLQECRENGEVRHRRSIRHGSAARGHQERVVNEFSRVAVYYNGHSDIQNEQGLKSRSKQREKKKVDLTT
jgi:hypothetical protein